MRASWVAAILVAVVGCTGERRAAPTAVVDARETGATSLDSATRARILEAVARGIEARYVFSDVGGKLASALRDHGARGDYDAIGTPDELATR
jgi:hypothetical protein